MKKNNLSLTCVVHHHDRRDHAQFARQRRLQGSRYSPGTRRCNHRRVLRNGTVAWCRRWGMQEALRSTNNFQYWRQNKPTCLMTDPPPCTTVERAALRSTTNFQYWRQNKPTRLMTDPPPCTAVDWDNRMSGPNHSW